MGRSPSSIIVWIAPAAAVFLLNASLTFINVWPTPAITWRGGLSLEFAVSVLALCIAGSRNRVHSRRLIAWISSVWVLLVLGRYADVTAPALYGRDINLYWDLRFIPDVVSMVTRVAPLWLVLAALAGIVLFVVILYAIVRWAWRRVIDMAAAANRRRTLAALAMAAVIVFVAARVSGRGGADLRRRLVARAHQPAVGHRGSRSRHECVADDAATRHDGEGVREARLQNGGVDARNASEVAGRALLRLRRHLRRRSPRVSRSGIRLVCHPGSVLARSPRRVRGEPAVAPAAVRLLPHHQHPLPLQSDAALSARLAPDHRPTPLRRSRHRPRLRTRAELDRLRPRIRGRAVVRLHLDRGLRRRARGSRYGHDRARRSSAAGRRQRRTCIVGRARARNRQPDGRTRSPRRSRIPARPHAAASVARTHAHSVADASRRVWRLAALKVV